MVTETKTGKLQYVGQGRLGAVMYYWSECVDCKTTYPSSDEAMSPSCNGHRISLCPFCRPDSAPWKYGRGR